MERAEINTEFVQQSGMQARTTFLDQYSQPRGIDPQDRRAINTSLRNEPRSVLPFIEMLRQGILGNVDQAEGIVPREFSLAGAHPAISRTEYASIERVINETFTVLTDGINIEAELNGLTLPFRPHTLNQKGRLGEIPTLRRYRLIQDNDYDEYTRKDILEAFFNPQRVEQIAQLVHAPEQEGFPEETWIIGEEARTQLTLSFTFLSYFFSRIAYDTQSPFYHYLKDFLESMASVFQLPPQVSEATLEFYRVAPGWHFNVAEHIGAPTRSQTRRSRGLPGSMSPLPHDVKPPQRIPRPHTPSED